MNGRESTSAGRESGSGRESSAGRESGRGRESGGGRRGSEESPLPPHLATSPINNPSSPTSPSRRPLLPRPSSPFHSSYAELHTPRGAVAAHATAHCLPRARRTPTMTPTNPTLTPEQYHHQQRQQQEHYKAYNPIGWSDYPEYYPLFPTDAADDLLLSSSCHQQWTGRQYSGRQYSGRQYSGRQHSGRQYSGRAGLRSCEPRPQQQASPPLQQQQSPTQASPSSLESSPEATLVPHHDPATTTAAAASASATGSPPQAELPLLAGACALLALLLLLNYLEMLFFVPLLMPMKQPIHTSTQPQPPPSLWLWVHASPPLPPTAPAPPPPSPPPIITTSLLSGGLTSVCPLLPASLSKGDIICLVALVIGILLVAGAAVVSAAALIIRHCHGRSKIRVLARPLRAEGREATHSEPIALNA